MNKLDEAAKELMKAREIDTRGTYSLKLAELDKQMTGIRMQNSRGKK